MACASFADELARYGPTSEPRTPPTLAESRDYCRRLAHTHYENFVVASLLLPRELRPHFHAVYAYCRWADDLADEVEPPQRALELLAWWQAELDACYVGRATHPVFVALGDTIREFGIAREPFDDLLRAFRQDQQQSRYSTYDELLGYCRYSANPVGRLVLYLGRCHDDARGLLSDHVCTGLQLANFWQDVARDGERGRVYLPDDVRAQFGYDDAMFAERRATPEFRHLLRWLCDRAERELRAGLPLVEQVPAALAGDIWLFVQGGLRILANIRALNYDVWTRRPTVSKLEQVSLVGLAAARNWLGRLRGPSP